MLAGAEMIGAGRDRTYPTAEGIAPGTGAVIAALEYATDRTATIVGKPDPQIFVTALDRLGPGRTLVIGDRLDADLGGAAAAGLDGAIVLTGVTSARAGGRGRRSGAGGGRRRPLRARDWRLMLSLIVNPRRAGVGPRRRSTTSARQ